MDRYIDSLYVKLQGLLNKESEDVFTKVQDDIEFDRLYDEYVSLCKQYCKKYVTM